MSQDLVIDHVEAEADVEVEVEVKEEKTSFYSQSRQKFSFKSLEKMEITQRERIKSILPIKEAKKQDKHKKSVRVSLERENGIKFSETLLEKSKEEKIENWKLLLQSQVKPFPLYNYSYTIESKVTKFGVETKSIFIFGGQTKYKKVNLVYQSDLTNVTNKLSWKNIFSINTPSPRINHSMTEVYNGFSYIFGGETHTGLINTTYSFEFFKFNTTDYTFTQLRTGPPARSCHSSIIYNGKVYIFGGTDGKKFYSDLWEYSIEKDHWDKIYIDYKPSPRMGHMMVTSEYDNGIYIFGGYRDKIPLKEIWRYDGEWNEIELKDTTLLPFKGSSCLGFGKRFIMFGGDIYSEKMKMNEVFLVDSDTIIRSGDEIIEGDPSDHFQLIFLNDRLLLLGNEGNNYILPVEGSFIGKLLLKGDLFGKSLKEVMERPDHDGLQIPNIIDQCLKILMEEKAYEMEGILRKSGRFSDVIYLTLIFENGMKFDENRFKDANSVSVVLKRYISSLPDPLVTSELSKDFISIQEVKNPIEEAQNLLNKLPKVNYLICKRLFLFLSLIWENRKDTLMDENNLSILLGHSILGSSNNTSEALLIFLKHYNDIFKTQKGEELISKH